MPINFLLIEALRRFHHYYGDDFRVECPTGSGRMLTLREIADELSGLFPQRGSEPLLFYEYYHGDTGVGLGASHQTGWTALIANLL